MKIENEVCSLKYTEELEKLGVEQDSFFYYAIPLKDESFKKYPNALQWKPKLITEFTKTITHIIYEKMYSAFTFIELWNKLPYTIHEEYYDYELVIFKSSDNQAIILYDGINGHLNDMEPIKDTPANAVARLYIYLIKNQLII